MGRGNEFNPIPKDRVFDRFVKAFNHPVRRRIISLLGETESESASTAALALGIPLGTVAYHFRVLNLECAVLELVTSEQVRGATKKIFRLAPISLSAQDWAAIQCLIAEEKSPLHLPRVTA